MQASRILAKHNRFLLAQLHLGSLSDKTTVKAVKLALEQLPKGSQGLYVAYDKTIERIDNQQPGFQQLAKQTLSWIVYATRQLRVLELRHALAIEDEATELDEENLTEADEIISACAGLVTIENDTDIIRLVHYTTQEYLERKFVSWMPLAEEGITRTCLTYLSFDVFTTKNPDVPKSYPKPGHSGYYYDICRRAFEKAPFLDYVVDAWYYHAKHCWNDVVEQLVLPFLERDSHILYYGAMRYIKERLGWGQSFRAFYGFKTMHLAALFGLDRVVAALLQAGYITRVLDGNIRTPLTYAAEFGQQTVTKLLLKDANVCDKNGHTPLHYAAMYGHENIVKLLLDCEGINVNAESLYLQTPLNLAIERDHEKVARLLLERDDIDVTGGPFGNRNTALMSCARRGSENLLQQLLERDDVDLNRRDGYGQTALMLAARFRNEKVFKQLLENPGVEVHHRNAKNRTLLMLAARSASEKTVELLLDRQDIDVNCKDIRGQTALMQAAGLRHWQFPASCSMVRRLLEREIDVNCQDKEGQTALMIAAACGNVDVVEELLKREDIDVNCQDNEGQTALMLAATSDYHDPQKITIRRLLEETKIDVHCRDKEGRTALMLAASKRKHKVVEILLKRDDIDLTGSDEDEKNLRNAMATLGLSR